MKTNTKMTIRVWKGSTLIGKKVKYINHKFNVTVTKVARGPETSDSLELTIEDGDYITFTGNSSNCLNLLRETYISL